MTAKTSFNNAQNSRFMKISYSFLLVALMIVASAFTIKNIVKETNTGSDVEVSAQEWTDVEKAVSLAKADQKKILIDVYTDWCKWCKVMDEQTFSDSEVSSYLAQNFHLAKFNAEQKESLTFNGKVFNFTKNGRRGYHEFAVDILNGQLAYPSLVVFDSNLNKLEVIRGFKNPQDLLAILSPKS